MKLRFSYHALLVTLLIFVLLILTLSSIKMSSEIVEEQKTIPVEYKAILPEEDQILPTQKTRITTNKAYNEAENFIRDAENQRINSTPSNTLENNKTSTSSLPSKTQKNLTNATQKLESIKSNISENKKENQAQQKEVSTKTTMLFSLKNRQAVFLANPVYTCQGSGKVVITILVNNLGDIINTTFNKAASTTTNACLIESALTYAKSAKFTPKKDSTNQIGTITYLFPGQ